MMYMAKMSILEFQKLGEEWMALDAEYDTEFQAFLDNPKSLAAENLGSLSQERFQSLAQEWIALDNEYDNFFQEFLKNPSVHSPEKIAQFRGMQGKVYPLEDAIYVVAERAYSAEEIATLKAKQKRLQILELELYRVAEGTTKIQD